MLTLFEQFLLFITFQAFTSTPLFEYIGRRRFSTTKLFFSLFIFRNINHFLSIPSSDITRGENFSVSTNESGWGSFHSSFYPPKFNVKFHLLSVSTALQTCHSILLQKLPKKERNEKQIHFELKTNDKKKIEDICSILCHAFICEIISEWHMDLEEENFINQFFFFHKINNRFRSMNRSCLAQN